MTNHESTSEQLSPVVTEYLEASTKSLLLNGVGIYITNFLFRAEHSRRDPATGEIGHHLLIEMYKVFARAELPMTVEFTDIANDPQGDPDEIPFKDSYYQLVKIDENGWLYNTGLHLFTIGQESDDFTNSLLRSIGLTPPLQAAIKDLAREQEEIGWTPLRHEEHPELTVNNPAI
jgi:hypothetical protein